MLEINPQHPIIIRLAAARSAGGEAETIAKLVAEQLLDNALIAAGLVDDPRTMLGRYCIVCLSVCLSICLSVVLSVNQ